MGFVHMKYISNKIEIKERTQDLRKNSTKAEKVLWEYLSNKKFENLKFRRQHSFGYYIVDFYCKEKKLLIEIDGDSHYTKNTIIYDNIRTKFLVSLNSKVIRFTNSEIIENIEQVLNTIKSFVNNPT